MKKYTHIIWIIVLLTAITGQWAFHKYIGESAPAKAEISDSPFGEIPSLVDEQKEEFYYTCGMHPHVHEDEPGICPICNMKLVRKTVGGSSGTVSIDPVTIQNMGVKSVPVEKRPLDRTIRAYGKIEYDDTRVVSVTTKISGWAEKLYVDHEGMFVKKGDPLVDIYSPELMATQEEYLQAMKLETSMSGKNYKDVINHARGLLESTKKRLLLWDVTEAQIKELEDTKVVKRIHTIYSPTSGVATMKMIHEGDPVKPNMHIYKISDITRVWVMADIYEYEMPWVKVGQEVSMALAYYPGEKFAGKITFIYPYLEAETRTARVRFTFNNADLKVKPDMYATVTIASALDDPALVVPVSAVIRSGERNVVIVDNGDGKFEPRNITTGLQTDDFYAVLDGVTEGEKVVTSAQFLIDSESRLREAQEKMLSGMTDAEPPAPTDDFLTFMGDGEMLFTCPMPEDMVFGDGEHVCPKCGMILEEMDESQMAGFEALKPHHEIKRVEGELVKYVYLLGEGKMTHTCPTEADMVFASEKTTCPIDGKDLRQMTTADEERQRQLQVDHFTKNLEIKK